MLSTRLILLPARNLNATLNNTVLKKNSVLLSASCSKRFLQTVIRTSSSSTSASSNEMMPSLNYTIEQEQLSGQRQQDETSAIANNGNNNNSNKWSKHSLPEGKSLKDLLNNTLQKQSPVTREKPKKRRRQLKPRKALITLSPNAVHHLSQLLDQPTPKMIRIGVRNRGCSGLTYHLEYVTEAGKFDEAIEQDGVKVLIDSKALFSIVGSEMDWIDDKLSSKFVFKNPNSKGTCGCGESFMV